MSRRLGEQLGTILVLAALATLVCLVSLPLYLAARRGPPSDFSTFDRAMVLHLTQTLEDRSETLPDRQRIEALETRGFEGLTPAP